MDGSKAKLRLGGLGRPLLAGILASAGTTASLPASADTFLLLDDVRGEATDSKHKDWIEILSYTQTFRNSASAPTGAVKVTCGDVTVLKSIDRSSPELVEGVVTGKFFKEAKIEFVATGGKDQVQYYVVTIRDVQLAAIEQTDQPDDARIVERVTLRGGEFRYAYRQQRADGTTAPPIEFSYDCRAVK
jgi:type VI secretion system secreted protein Hcp